MRPALVVGGLGEAGMCTAKDHMLIGERSAVLRVGELTQLGRQGVVLGVRGDLVLQELRCFHTTQQASKAEPQLHSSQPRKLFKTGVTTIKVDLKYATSQTLYSRCRCKCA